MKPDEEEFFKTGTRAYGEALRAVCEFETLLDAEMRAAMSRCSGRLQLSAEPRFTHGVPPPSVVVQNASVFYFVYAPLALALDPSKKSSTLEVGVQWPGPEDPNRAVCVLAGVSTDGVYSPLTPVSFRGEVLKSGRLVRLKCDVRENDLSGTFAEIFAALESSL